MSEPRLVVTHVDAKKNLYAGQSAARHTVAVTVLVSTENTFEAIGTVLKRLERKEVEEDE